MNVDRIACAAAAGALLLAFAGPSLAQTASAPPIDPVARQLAEGDLAHAVADVKRPVRAEMDVENAETVLANGAEARGAHVQQDEQPFAQMVTARHMLLGRDGVWQDVTAIQTAETAAQQ